MSLYGALGLDLKVAFHNLAIKKDVSLKKQPQRCFCLDLIPEIEQEVNKLINTGIIHEVKYPTWIANFILVKKRMANFAYV